MKSVLFLAAEAAPFIKTGGLGDVVGSLPKELNKRGMDARIILPLYNQVKAQKKQMTFLGSITVPLGWRNQYCGLYQLEKDAVTYYFCDNEYYFCRPGIYGYGDDAERFAFFSRAVLEALPHIQFVPDILHCNDWHTGVVPVLLKAHYHKEKRYEGISTVLTIHNIQYQGVFDVVVLGDLLELDKTAYFADPALYFNGKANFLKMGIEFADLLTTVSPSYLEEIVTPQGGCQLGDLLKKRSQNMIGIANGVDYDKYNPVYDKAIYKKYSAQSWEYKAENKCKLQQELGLAVDATIPLIAMVSRMVDAKGFSLLTESLEKLLCMKVQLVILGTGEAHYEEFFRKAAAKNPQGVSVSTVFDENLAHRIYAASDLYLMPSLHEPCGLSQMMALRYGSIPIVRMTGGLKDTITPFSETTGEGNGFCFSSYTPGALLEAVAQALKLYYDRTVWGKLVTNAMNADNSWDHSAGEYFKMYSRLE